MRRLAILSVAMIALGVLCERDDPPPPPPVVVATFNIENFPKDERQVEGAFDEIAALGAGIVAVQEIGEPGVFARAAQRRLGARWRFVHLDTRPRDATSARFLSHHIGVLYDADVYRVRGVDAHDDTRVGRQKPTLEVRLAPRSGGGPELAVFVVHLKSGGDYRHVRTQQLAALGRLLEATRRAHPERRVVVLGDFNATDDGDRVDIAAIAASSDLAWATEPLGCSAFWDRDDGCPRSRLDHVLTWTTPLEVHAAGACATEGCDWQDRCPLYAEHVSDHCPVVVTLPAAPAPRSR